MTSSTNVIASPLPGGMVSGRGRLTAFSMRVVIETKTPTAAAASSQKAPRITVRRDGTEAPEERPRSITGNHIR